MELHGANILGSETSGAGATVFHGVNPATGEQLAPAYHEATEREISRALELAGEAFAGFRSRKPEQRADFLEAIAAGLEQLGDELLDRAAAETALPLPRLVSERGRTCAQLRMFAALLREGSWVGAIIDRAQPERTPAPKPDLRRMLIPIGPIVVFGASNFPFAYSVAGGDTASALAAGNPVVAKGHPAHPGASELAGRVIQQAARDCGMPAGVFSLVHGPSPAVGQSLVRHPLASGVGFTGSLAAGRALFDAAAARPDPIPVFAEMGSLNPVFVLPGALQERGPEIADALARSVTQGLGQFCTKPGLAVGLGGAELDAFTRRLSEAVGATPAGTMLHAGIAERYRGGIAERGGMTGIATACAPAAAAPHAGATGAVFTTDAKTYLSNRKLHEELFGPQTLVVASDSASRLLEIARRLEGQLTVTIHASASDLRQHAALLDVLRQKAGRLVFGGVPTGVEVVPAMQHGGPYPATTDSRFSSVGTTAIRRWVRPVCYQNFPAEWLPDELKDDNPRGIWRMIDGEWTRAAVV
ncbi:MAG TPA: aldehyde dehydrogenase (NADP(+)) [Terriglobales bacterium]|nr:aldehyde dehydrogenase (NADP(+)) [Terriglobales bacterium]